MNVSMANKQADHYRVSAERMLAEAQKATHPQIKAKRLEIADRYRWLAEVVERRIPSAEPALMLERPIVKGEGIGRSVTDSAETPSRNRR